MAAAATLLQHMSSAVQAFGKNPDMLKSAAKMMQSMPKEQLQAALAQSGMAANVDPAMLSMATEAISKMPPEQLEQMAKMAASMQQNMAGGGGSSGSMLQQPASAALPAGDPPGHSAVIPADSAGAATFSTGDTAATNISPAADGRSAGAAVSGMMTPEMMKMAAEMMQNMKPEDLAAMQQMMETAGPGGSIPPGAGQMMTPEMMKMASSMMKNMKPEDFAAMQQMMGAGSAQGSAGMPSGWTGKRLLAVFSSNRRHCTACITAIPQCNLS